MQLIKKKYEINLLVAVNDAYIDPLSVMLFSVFINNKDCKFTVYLVYSHISDNLIKKLKRFVEKHSHKFEPIKIDNTLFEKFRFRDFSLETYYRLFAFHYLPKELDRILF